MLVASCLWLPQPIARPLRTSFIGPKCILTSRLPILTCHRRLVSIRQGQERSVQQARWIPHSFTESTILLTILRKGFRHGKYSPLETADRLESMATTAAQYLSKAVELAVDPQAANFQRFVTDTRMLVHIGQFFANKFRAALSYALSERTGDVVELERALDLYKLAREHWVKVIAISQVKYKADIAFGYTDPVRGHWSDRLPAIEADIQAMERQLQTTRTDASRTVDSEKLQAAMRVLNASPVDRRQLYVHQAPAYFSKGEKLGVQLELPGASDGLKVVLHYRHSNQSEHYVVKEMNRDGAGFAAEIPAAYTESPYGILYFFEVVESDGGARLYPGLNEDISNQPYYFVQSR